VWLRRRGKCCIDAPDDATPEEGGDAKVDSEPGGRRRLW